MIWNVSVGIDLTIDYDDIEADSREEAERKAWQMFPEYHEIGVYKV
jgi:hypothetical protein